MVEISEPQLYNIYNNRGNTSDLEKRLAKLEYDFKNHIHEGTLVCPYYTEKPIIKKKK